MIATLEINGWRRMEEVPQSSIDNGYHEIFIMTPLAYGVIPNPSDIAAYKVALRLRWMAHEGKNLPLFVYEK
jgi:hypothetical protein